MKVKLLSNGIPFTAEFEEDSKLSVRIDVKLNKEKFTPLMKLQSGCKIKPV